MTSSPYRCGSCESRFQSEQSRLNHRKEVHSERFDVHGRCGICDIVYSDLFSFLDHFEKIHHGEYHYLLERGSRMMGYPDPPSLLFIRHVYIGVKDEVMMNYEEKESLRSIIRNVGRELGREESESDEEDDDDGFEPPPSRPPDRVLKDEVTPSIVEDVKMDEVLDDVEKKESDDENGNEMMIIDNSLRTPVIVENVSRMELHPPIDCSLVSPIDVPSRPMSELERLLQKTPELPQPGWNPEIEQWIDDQQVKRQEDMERSQREERERVEREQQEKEKKEQEAAKERMAMIERQNRRGAVQRMIQKRQHQKMHQRPSVHPPQVVPVHQQEQPTTQPTPILPHPPMRHSLPPQQLQQQFPPQSLQLKQTSTLSLSLTPEQLVQFQLMQQQELETQQLLHRQHLARQLLMHKLQQSVPTVTPFPTPPPQLLTSTNLTVPPPHVTPQHMGVNGQTRHESLPTAAGTPPPIAISFEEFTLQHQEMCRQAAQQHEVIEQQQSMPHLQQTQLQPVKPVSNPPAATSVDPRSTIAPLNQQRRRASDEPQLPRREAVPPFIPSPLDMANGAKKRRIEIEAGSRIADKTTKISLSRPQLPPGFTIEPVLPRPSAPNVVRHTQSRKAERMDEPIGSPKSSVSNESLPSIASPVKSNITGTSDIKKTSGKEVEIVSTKFPCVLKSTDAPCKIDQEFWLYTSTLNCPRGCGPVGETKALRQTHYIKFHYPIFYALDNALKAKQEKWIAVQLGCKKDGVDRVCVHCPSNRSLIHISRNKLMLHIRESHPAIFLKMSREYLDVRRNDQILYRSINDLLTTPLPSSSSSQ